MENHLTDYIKAYNLLKKYKINAAEGKYVNDADEAVSFANGKSIVLKGISQKALHKTKSGLVALNLHTKEEIKKGFLSIQKAATRYKPYKVLAQRMVPYNSKNIEIIIGGKVDSQFGKLLLIGLGGIYVEIFRDFSVRLCPINRHDAESMIDDLKSKNVIAKTEKERRMLINILLKVSGLLEGNKITELDLNTIIICNGKYSAVDIRILR